VEGYGDRWSLGDCPTSDEERRRQPERPHRCGSPRGARGGGRGTPLDGCQDGGFLSVLPRPQVQGAGHT
jgi:hypothetical protein